ncbi:GAF and ANTAR domain-containing protein [Mycolicibacterium sp. CBM1]
MLLDDDADLGDAPNRIAEIARRLYERRRSDAEVVAELVEHAVAELPGVDYANVTVISGRHGIATPSATHPCAVRIDDIQRRHRQGPCLSSAWHRKTIRVDDLETDTRWPKFRTEALLSTPVRSIMGFQMFVTDTSMSALNVFAERPKAFDDATHRLGVLFATQSALVWDAARREAQFREALASRDIIGQAKGMIMERYSTDADQAFDMLRQLSHDANVPLTEVAIRIVDAARSNPR